MRGAGEAWSGQDRQEAVAVEEPLEIRLVDAHGVTLPFAVAMRTPGHDVDLALGFCVGEGLVASSAEVAQAGLCTTGPIGVGRAVDRFAEEQTGAGAAVEVRLATGIPLPAAAATRRVLTTSACGVCGTATIDAVRSVSRYDVTTDGISVAASVLATMPDRLRQRQRGFDRTGGLHAAGVFDASGRPLCVREDVGRHNAVDKAVGWALQHDRLPLRGHVLQVSGRVSFEIIQKAALAGIPVVAAVSAPTSLAVDLATELGVTLVAFSRGNRLTVFAGPERVSR